MHELWRGFEEMQENKISHDLYSLASDTVNNRYFIYFHMFFISLQKYKFIFHYLCIYRLELGFINQDLNMIVLDVRKINY